jgi:hypothetical protein
MTLEEFRGESMGDDQSEWHSIFMTNSKRKLLDDFSLPKIVIDSKAYFPADHFGRNARRDTSS